jgi:hypothetical protein
MYVPQNKEKLYINDIEIQNISPDGKVFFLEEAHKYYHIDDIKDNNLVPFSKSKYKFKSPTGIIGKFHEKFDSMAVSEAYVVKHMLDITAEELREQWSEKARVASERGSMLHSLGESILDGWDFGELPELPQVSHLLTALDEIADAGWRLAKTELLVYNTGFKIAGQADIVLKRPKKDAPEEFEYGIFDYKFLKDAVSKKSFFNPRTRQYKKMYSLFKHLPDTNYYHYSIQLEFYKLLMGSFGDKVITKQLIVVTEKAYYLEDCFPINLWVDSNGYLQAKYKLWTGRVYDSSKDKAYMKEPYKII